MATTYTFEHVNRPKAVHINVDSRDLMRGRERPYPNENYLSGNGMSTVWMGHGHYAPHNRQWQMHHEKMALPNDRVAGQLEFQTEDHWRDWTHRRDRPYSKYCGGMAFKNSSPPDLKLSGYAFNPYNLHRTGVAALTLHDPLTAWPKTQDRSFTTWRGPRGAYGYCHEELDAQVNGADRLMPRDLKVLASSGEVAKQSVEFPVLK